MLRANLFALSLAATHALNNGVGQLPEMGFNTC